MSVAGMGVPSVGVSVRHWGTFAGSGGEPLGNDTSGRPWELPWQDVRSGVADARRDVADMKSARAGAPPDAAEGDLARQMRRLTGQTRDLP